MSNIPSPEHFMLFYGVGGAGKTNLIRRLAEFLWRKYELKTRVVGADGGGRTPFKVLIKKGIIDYWPIDQWGEERIFRNLQSACQGEWPSDTSNPGSELLPCSRIIRPCPSCGKDIGAKGLTIPAKCQSCNKAIPPGVRPEGVTQILNGFEEVGLVAFEGATALGSLLMERLKDINPEGGHYVNDKEGDFKIAQGGKSHYLNAQSYLKRFIAKSRTIPTKVVVWTALELRGKDEYDAKVYGPAFPGKALTSACVPWFSDVLHLDLVQEKGKDGRPKKDENGFEILSRKLYLEKHFPEDTKPYGFEAKSSAPEGCGMPKLLDVPEGENVMERYFTELEKAYAKAEKEIE